MKQIGSHEAIEMFTVIGCLGVWYFTYIAKAKTSPWGRPKDRTDLK